MLLASPPPSPLGHAVYDLRGCYVRVIPHQRPALRVRLCGNAYVDLLIAANPLPFRDPIERGVQAASGGSAAACTCAAKQLERKAQKVSQYSRRRFRDWWKQPGTKAGHRLKGCLIGAAIALGGHIVQYLATGDWDDASVISDTGYACGIGAVTRGG
jgi:hypothetical protein